MNLTMKVNGLTTSIYMGDQPGAQWSGMVNGVLVEVVLDVPPVTVPIYVQQPPVATPASSADPALVDLLTMMGDAIVGGIEKVAAAILTTGKPAKEQRPVGRRDRPRPGEPGHACVGCPH